MKGLLYYMLDERIVKEIKSFAIASIMLSIIGLIILWWLGIAGLAFGIRGVILSMRKKQLSKYTIVSLTGAILGLLAIVLYKI